MIRAVHLENFQSHADTTFVPERFTALVGQNAAGKTSVLEALSLLGELGRRTVSDVFADPDGPDAFARRGAVDPMQVTAVIQHEAATWKVFVKRTPGTPIADGCVLEPLSRSRMMLPAEVAKRISTRLHRFDLSRVGEPSSPIGRDARLSKDGSNTAAVLATLKLVDDGRFDFVRDMLRAVIPNVLNLSLEHAPLADGHVGYRARVELAGAGDFPVARAGDGVRAVLAIMTAVFGEAGPRVLLLDDIDRGLHPRAQVEVVKQLRTALEVDQDLQMVVTTHSPHLVDALTLDDVWVCHLGGEGATVMRRLSEHPDAARTRRALTGGQLWSLAPESWVAEDE